MLRNPANVLCGFSYPDPAAGGTAMFTLTRDYRVIRDKDDADLTDQMRGVVQYYKEHQTPPPASDPGLANLANTEPNVPPFRPLMP